MTKYLIIALAAYWAVLVIRIDSCTRSTSTSTSASTPTPTSTERGYRIINVNDFKFSE